MRQAIWVVAVLIAVAAFGSAPARAQIHQGPWCSQIPTAGGEIAEDCEWDTLAQCRRAITGGNRGFCTQNPNWHGKAPAKKKKRSKQRQ